MFLYNAFKSEVFIKVVGTSLDIFGNVRTSSGNHQKSSEVTVTFSEIPVMTRRKSHAFDSEKVGRYTFAFLLRTNKLLNKEGEVEILQDKVTLSLGNISPLYIGR